MTRDCCECKKHRFEGREEEPELKCNVGHKPRFYMPRSLMDYHAGRHDTWGWRRECDDYDEEDGK
jgi:hypothetical protein